MDVKIMSCYLVEGVFEYIPIQNGMRVEHGGRWNKHSERTETEKQFMEILDSTWEYHEIKVRHKVKRRIEYLE